MHPLRGRPADQGGRSGQADGADRRVRRGRRPAGPRGGFPGPADRREGTGRRRGFPPDRDEGPRRGAAPARERTHVYRPEGDRQHVPHRKGAARVDHRRPADGQDGRGPGRDHQPEGPGRGLYLRRRRPEGFHDRQDGRDPGGTRRHGVHHRGRGLGQHAGADAVPGALRRRDHGRALPRQRQARPRHLRRSDQARGGLPAVVAEPAAAAGPGSLSGGRVLPPLPAPGAGGQDERRIRMPDR